MFLEALLWLCGVGAVLWAYGRWCHGSWARAGVPSPPATPLLGHVLHVFSSTRPKWAWQDEAYHRHGGRAFCGLYNFLTPQLLLGDPLLLKDVLVRHFDHFVDRRHLDVAGEDDQLWNDMLSNASGERWKSIRAAVTPAFTSSRLKVMIPLVTEKAEALARVAKDRAGGGEAVELKALFGNFSMDATASCGFGMECDSLNGRDSHFCQIAAKIFNPSKWRLLKIVSFYIAPRLCRALGMRVTSDALRYFAKVVTETLNRRQETGDYRGDFLDLMLEARKTKGEENQPRHALDDVTVVSQAVVFLLSGYDNNASALAFCCFFLARHPELQSRARAEVRRLRAAHAGVLSLDALNHAHFLDACLAETLRLYPIETSFNRQCVKDYTLGATGVRVPQGMVVEVPVWSLHRDPAYWEAPLEFRPERFLPENKERLVPFAYMPFGSGPRGCIGQRFTSLQTKIALAFLLEAVAMTPAPGHEDLPELVISPVILRPKNGIHVLFHPLTEQ